MKSCNAMRRAMLAGGLLVPGLALSCRWPPRIKLPEHPRFVVYYGSQGDAALYGHDVAVLDAEVDIDVLRRFDAAALLLGYLSLGEVHMGRAYAAELALQGLLLPHNPQWPDARFVDVRDPRWKRRVLDELVPALRARGFGGLFLDTLDSVAYLESLDAGTYAGMADAAVDLVHSIRCHHPDLAIMLNRGYAVLPRVVSDIDMLLGESVHSTYETGTQTYVPVAPEAVRWQLDQMNEARRVRPALRLFSLDYWWPGDVAGIERLYAQAQANGLVPYVATIELSRVVPRP